VKGTLPRTRTKKKEGKLFFDMLQERERTFLASSFIMGSDEDRGIVTIVYKCSECGDTDTERLFSDKPIPKALCCVKCGAGFKIDERDFGVTNHPAMWPMEN
jgi:hypothetical protein